ncbi:MAG: GLUG motif-containing protein [Thermoplasmata archaeon]
MKSMYKFSAWSFKFLVFVFAISLGFSFLPYGTTEGSIDLPGTENNPYQISCWYQLNDMRYDLDSHYELISDLNRNSPGYDELVDTEQGWEPIGNGTARFMGIFDGNYHVISDLYINRSQEWRTGLFDFVGQNAVIKNVGLDNVEIYGDWYVGGLIGVNHGYVEGTYTTGKVTGLGYDVGGLIGLNYGNVEISYSSADVTGGGARVGGLIGNHNYDSVVNCYATGSVEGAFQAGGFIGWNHWGYVHSSYAMGAVAGGANLGGLIGQNWRGTVQNSFWDVETSMQGRSGGGTGMTTVEMKNVDTFTEVSTHGLTTPWDFVDDPNHDQGVEDIWDIDGEINQGYPFFYRWGVDEEPVVYELTIHRDGDGVIRVDGAEVEIPFREEYVKETEVNIEVVPDDGWKFVGWGDGVVDEEQGISVVMDDHKELTAIFAVDAWVKIEPETLNLRSRGRWITGYIGLPEAFQGENDLIDVDTVVLRYREDEVSADWGRIQGDGILMVKFDRTEVGNMLEPGEVELTVEGALVDGRQFVGNDTINVINPGR